MVRSGLRLLFAVAALYAPTALATNGMRMTGFGPVQDGMGGASVAAPLDSATIVSNPAGLAALAPRADAGATYFGADVEYEASGAASGRRIASDRGAMPVPTLGLVVPSLVDERLTVGIGAFGVAGMGVDYGQDLYGGTTLTSYTNMRIAPAAAYRLSDRLSVGAALNVMYALMEYDVASGMGLVPRDTAGSFGLGATVGVLYRPTDRFSLGASYESRSFFQAFEFDVPAHSVMTGMNPDGSPILTPVPGGTEALDFDQPQLATIGAAVRPLEGLVLAVDVEWIRWSETNGADLPAFDTNPDLTGGSRWNMAWDDQVVLKLGAQYEATRWLTVRAGYDWGKSPLDPDRAFENIAFPAIAEHHFSAGAGFALGTTVVNVAASWSPEATLSGGNPAQNLPAYETTMSQLAFDLGVGYRF
jgi:long-chain fatty acid transport protein